MPKRSIFRIVLDLLFYQHFYRAERYSDFIGCHLNHFVDFILI